MAWVTTEESLAKYGTPAYTGWGQTEADADFRAKGGNPGAGQSSSGNQVTDFANLFGQSAASTVELPPITTKTWEEYEAQALEELKPYYERLLKEAGGDVEKAKTRMQEDYDRGVRINRQDYEASKAGLGSGMRPGESSMDFYNRTKGNYGTFAQEGIDQFGNLNKRGLVNSGIATTEASKLQTSQQRRQEALDRAITRYEENAGIDKTRGLADINTGWERQQFQMGEQKKQEAATLGRQKRADDVSTQEIERQNIMRKAINNIYG